MINGEFISAKPPFFSGWASGATGHWGILVDDMLYHLVLDLDQDKNPVGIEFRAGFFRQTWIDEGRVTSKEEIGSTTLPSEALEAIGETLILQFGDYRRLYRNSQAFADIFVQVVCDRQRNSTPIECHRSQTLGFLFYGN